METVTLNREQLKELMNEAATAALDLDKKIRESIQANPDQDPDGLIRKSIVGIAGDMISKKAFNEL